MNNICNIRSCKLFIEGTYKKCLKHRLLNRASQQKIRGIPGVDAIAYTNNTICTRSICLKKKIYDKINKYYSTDKKKGLLLENYITVEYIKKLIDNTTTCIYCNEKILYSYTKNDKKQFSVDRIDSNLSHCIGNVQIICLTCNCSKQDKTHEEFIQYIENKNSCIS